VKPPLDAAVVYFLDTGRIHSEYTVGRLADEVEVERDFDKTRAKVEAWLLVTETYGKGMGSFFARNFHPDQIAAKTPHLRVTVDFRVDKRGRRVAKYHFHEIHKGSGQPGDPLYMDVINGKQTTAYLQCKAG